MLYQIYCIEIDDCGFSDWIEELPIRLICPECGAPLLIYDYNDIPPFIKEIQNEHYPMDSDEYETPDKQRTE